MLGDVFFHGFLESTDELVFGIFSNSGYERMDFVPVTFFFGEVMRVERQYGIPTKYGGYGGIVVFHVEGENVFEDIGSIVEAHAGDIEAFVVVFGVSFAGKDGSDTVELVEKRKDRCEDDIAPWESVSYPAVVIFFEAVIVREVVFAFGFQNTSHGVYSGIARKGWFWITASFLSRSIIFLRELQSAVMVSFTSAFCK